MVSGDGSVVRNCVIVPTTAAGGGDGSCTVFDIYKKKKRIRDYYSSCIGVVLSVVQKVKQTDAVGWGVCAGTTLFGMVPNKITFNLVARSDARMM